MHNADELHFVRIVYFVHFSQLSGRLCKNNDDRTKFCSAASWGHIESTEVLCKLVRESSGPEVALRIIETPVKKLQLFTTIITFATLSEVLYYTQTSANYVGTFQINHVTFNLV